MKSTKNLHHPNVKHKQINERFNVLHAERYQKLY